MQLIRLAVVALSLVAAFASIGRADDEFVAKTQIYVDSDATTVVSPLVRIAKDAWTGSTLGASFIADVVSSASVDVVTNATKHMSDFRKEGTASLTQKISDTTLSGAYIYSTENDYRSHNLHVGVAQDLLQKNTNLSLGYSLSLNDVGRSGDANFHRGLTVHTLDAAYTQNLDPRTIFQVSGTFQNNSGYQASPYRFVRIEAGNEFKVPETDPNTRNRVAAVAALNRHLGKDTALQGDYRFYIDDWGVRSHTVQLRYLVNVGPVTLRLRGRFYYQNGASFFESHYLQVQSFVTSDRELSDFWSVLGGGKIDWKIAYASAALILEAKTDLFYFGYSNFAYLSSRTGANIEAGLTVQY